MKSFEIVVPYFVAESPRQLTLRVRASCLEEAKTVAANRAVVVRPLLGSGVTFPGGRPHPDLAPNRAA